jgi:hypothetical protein
MNANKLEASRLPKQSFAPKNILNKAIEQVKNPKNFNSYNNKKTTVNRSISLKDSVPLNLKSIITNSNSVSNLNVIAETINENETFLGNDSQSTLSNRSSLDDMNEDYGNSNKYDNGGYKSEMNYSEARTYRMMNNKFSETYKEIIKGLLTEKLLAYQMQYQSYLPDGQVLVDDEVESLNNYKQHQIEKKNQRRQKNLSISINNNNSNNNVTNVRRGSNSFSAGIKPAIKLNRVATAYEKKNPRSPADQLNVSTRFKEFIDSNTNNNVVNFSMQKRPSLFSAPQSTVEEHTLQDSLFKKSFSKANSNFSFKSPSNTASYVNTNNSRRSILSSMSSQSNKSKLKSSESNISSSNKSDSNSTIRLADLMFDGYVSKKEVAIVLEQDPNVYTETRNNKIEQEPDYLTPSFKIQKFDIKNAKELDQAKLEIYKRYAFIDDPNVRAKSAINFSPSSKISTSFKRI